MSVYDNNKVYPTLPSAPEDPAQHFRTTDFRRSVRSRNSSLEEMEEREKLAKKVRQDWQHHLNC